MRLTLSGLIFVLALFSVVGIGQGLSRIRALKLVGMNLVPVQSWLQTISESFLSEQSRDRAAINAAHNLAVQNTFLLQRGGVNQPIRLNDRSNFYRLSPTSKCSSEAVLNHGRITTWHSISARRSPATNLSHADTIASARARRQGPGVLANAERSAKNINNIELEKLSWLA